MRLMGGDSGVDYAISRRSNVVNVKWKGTRLARSLFTLHSLTYAHL